MELPAVVLFTTVLFKKTGTFFGLNEDITLISVGSIIMDHLRNKSSGGVFSWHLSYIIIPNKRNTLLKSNQTRGNKQDVLIFEIFEYYNPFLP